MQINVIIFQKIEQNGEGKFGKMKKKYYLCSQFK